MQRVRRDEIDGIEPDASVRKQQFHVPEIRRVEVILGSNFRTTFGHGIDEGDDFRLGDSGQFVPVPTRHFSAADNRKMKHGRDYIGRKKTG